MILLNPNLDAFIAVAELSSISLAAERLALSQTGATKRIKNLEGELGLTLFTRSRRGMKLTAEGKALLRHCLEVRGQEGRLLTDLGKGKIDSEIDFTLVGPANMFASRTVEQTEAVLKKWPGLNLRFQIEARANRLNLLKSGAADLAVLMAFDVPNELDSKLLKPLEFQMVATAKWRERSFRDIVEKERLFAYHPNDPTSLEYLKLYGLLESLKRSRLYCNENLTLEALLVRGVGFGLLTKEIARPWVESGELVVLNQGRSLKMEMALAWYPRREAPGYLRDLIRAIG